jgi:anti-sigma regulatory factor (Ser/Thr protein kinase)
MQALLLAGTGKTASEAAAAREKTRVAADADDLIEQARGAGRCVALLPMTELGDRADGVLEELRRRAPEAATCLIAEPETLDLALDVAARGGAQAILPAGGWRRPDEWGTWIDWVGRPEKANFFDFYLGRDVEAPTRWLQNDADRRRLEADWRDAMEEMNLGVQQRFDARLILDELLNNAWMHGLADETAACHARMSGRMILAKHQWIEARFARHGNRLALTIADSGGRLASATAFERLHRQFTVEGLHATSGRGIFLAHQLSARMLTRVTPGRRTEINVLFLKDPESAFLPEGENGGRPILALEVGAFKKPRSREPGVQAEPSPLTPVPDA